MDIEFTITDDEVQGELALKIPPGTTAQRRDQMVDQALSDPLFELAAKMGVVLAADPHAYARALDGHDEEGRNRFAVSGRIEGDRLIPIRAGKRRRK